MYTEGCLKCSKKLSDPVCIRCYLKEFVIWLNDQNLSLDRRSKLMKLIKTNLMSDTLFGDSCILCKKKEVCMCQCCFFMNIKSFLETVNFSDEKLEQYRVNFNYVVPIIE